MAKKKPAKKAAGPSVPDGNHLYTLNVWIIGGNLSEAFVKKNPEISRTVQIRGDQTLDDLHEAIFDAFGRWEMHMYEFQFGKGPHDPKGDRYVMPQAADMDLGGRAPSGSTDQTTIDSLGLKVGRRFGYWFDFGDDWWHQIDVEQIDDQIPRGKYPKVIKRVGESPPQYPEESEDWDEEDDEESEE